MAQENENINLKKLLIRTCEEYYDEYKNCKNIKSRFHQYFIYGETLDCSDWKKDYDKCVLYEKTGDDEILDEVIESENVRRRTRLEAHVKNDVWTRRKEPPKNWDSPLPDWLNERAKYSYLNYKSLEDNEQAPLKPLSCNIL